MGKAGLYLDEKIIFIMGKVLLEVRNETQEQALEKIRFVGNFLEKVDKKTSVDELRLAVMAAASITCQRYKKDSYEKIIKEAESVKS